MTAQFLQVTRFMHVADIGAAVTVSRDLPGFAVEAGVGNPLLPGNRRFRYDFDVRDVDGHSLFDARQKVPPP